VITIWGTDEAPDSILSARIDRLDTGNTEKISGEFSFQAVSGIQLNGILYETMAADHGNGGANGVCFDDQGTMS
jgi:hypothetical protein